MLISTVLSILVLATFGLVIGAIALHRRGGSGRQVVLMLLVAVILAGNVVLWTLPDANGQSPLTTRLR